MKALTISFILLYLLLSAAAAAGGKKIHTLKVATWNIEWLNSREMAGVVKRKIKDYAKLGEYAALLDADIIALQEVDGVKAAEKVFGREKYTFEFSGRGNVQSVGIGVRNGTNYVRNPDYRALGLSKDHLRWGVDLTVKKNNKKIRFLCIHLKGNCHEGSLNKTKSCRKLNRQLAILEEWIDKRAREGVPFAVLGDFNRRLNSEDLFWKEIDDSVPPESDLNNPGEGKKSKCMQGKYPDFIDHIILSRKAGKSLSANSFSQLVFLPHDEKRFVLSDHCPVSVSLDF